METIKLYKQNSSNLFIDTNPLITKEIMNYFSAKSANYKFHPLYKKGLWDGTLNFVKNGIMPIGLKEELYKFAENRYNIELEYDEPSEEISEEDFKKFVSELNLPFEPRDYQFQAAFDGINNHILNIKSVTSSGKSLIIYLIMRFLDFIDKKTILIVPLVSLVEQMFSDFIDYGWNNVESKCHRIYAGQKKVFNVNCIISTWQSLYKDTSLFSIFDSIIIDEVHGNNSNSKSLSKISNSCINAKWRIGLSGTFPEYKTADWFTVVGSTGNIVEYSTYKKLQDSGHISKLKIFNVILQYPELFKKWVLEKGKKDYSKEIDLIYDNVDRHKFIFKLANKLQKNTLILFTKKEKLGYPLLQIFKQYNNDKEIFYIDGDTDPKEREFIRKNIELKDNVILLASYGTFSTGISIKNLNNIIFASGYKSKIKVLQSIGRGLRKHQDKTEAKIYDIIDNLYLKPEKYINYSLLHFKERLKFYKEEQFNYVNVEKQFETNIN